MAILFCLPLFVGLDRVDLRSDEAIYAYSIDRMLETGDWLTPKSIRVDGPFLEKPPLKIWMTAALIRIGALPRNETGYRTLDALLGAIAFIYVYALGVRLAGVLCGMASVLMLFTLDALVFEHGLRSNNMEAALFLCYAGGIYHFIAWSSQARRRTPHIAGVCLYFVLGFMTKFVAALFLPVIVAAAMLVCPQARERIRSDWRTLCVALSLAALAILPWFAVQTVLHGTMFWSVILGTHVVTRFTSALDPSHLEPWHFYFDVTWSEMARAGSRYAGTAGAAFLLIMAWVGRHPWRILAAWWVLPFLAISIGTSKLGHYAYPFWPPLALSVGGLAAYLWAFPTTHSTWASSSQAQTVSWWLGDRSAGRWVRAACGVAGLVALLVAVGTAMHGRLTWEVAGVTIFRNSSIERAAMLGVILLALAGPFRLAHRLLMALILAFALPVSSYPEQIAKLYMRDRQLGVLRECLRGVSPAPDSAPVFDAAHSFDNHSFYYYLYSMGSWIERPDASAEEVMAHLTRDSSGPALVAPGTLRQLSSRNGRLNGVSIHGDAILLPERFSRCAHATVLAGAARVVQ